MENKKYYVVDLMHDDESIKSFYVVDRVHKKILYYNMASDCKDETAGTKRIYSADKNKPYFDRRLGCNLVEIMEGLPYKGLSKDILVATDDAREATRKIASIRATWFSIRAKRLERTAASESAGWGDTADDDFIAEHFNEL